MVVSDRWDSLGCPVPRRGGSVRRGADAAHPPAGTLLGTLYIAERYEETPWGLAPKDQREYTTLSDNLTTPFREIFRILRGKQEPQLVEDNESA